MEIKLYKLEVIKGKEDVARQWMKFLDEHKREASYLLKEECAYLEAYFTAVENNTMYIYLLFALDSAEHANAIALASRNSFNLKHFEHMKDCVDLMAGVEMDCLFYMDNLLDVHV